MNITPAKNRSLHLTTHALYLLFFTSLIFSWRAISSMSISAILLTGIVASRFITSVSFQTKARTWFVIGCAALVLLQVVALIYTKDSKEGWNSVRIKTGLVITPLAVYLSHSVDATMQRKLFFQYCLLLTIASLYCLGIAFYNYREPGNVSVFFYHSLVKPISQHAIYFSLLVLIGLIYLLEAIRKNHLFFPRLFYLSLILFLSIFLLLLTSKLVISFYLAYLFLSFMIMLKKNKASRTINTSLFTLGVLTIILVFAIPNPISRRFYDIVKGDINIVTQDKFKPSDYFNGLQFRLLQWKFVPEILTENKRWWIGVSPGDAQYYLNEKYLSKNMYSGDPAKGTRGYLIYNTHNQFLQTTLQTGIIGLLILIAICFCMLKMALKHNSRLAIFITLVLLAWLFTESAFETQYGIVIFTFFPMFLTAADILKGQMINQFPECKLN